MSCRTGTVSANYTPHDTNEIPQNEGFIPNITGTIVGQLRHDTANRNIPVTAGVRYFLDLKLFHTTSTSVTSVLVITGTRTA